MAGSSRTTARSRIKSAGNTDDEDSQANAKPTTQRIRKERSRNQSSLSILNFNLRYLLLFAFASFLVAAFVIYHLVTHVEEVEKLRVVTPFPAPKIMDLPQFQGEHKESLYWGTYRPHAYLGIRSRTPQSLIAGLMWLGVKDGRYLMRHICQDSDELSTYGWIQHNGRDYGQQVIVDQGTTLTTSFLKSKMDGSGYGGDWAVRVDMENKKSTLDEAILGTGHFFFYVADEEGNDLSLGRKRLDIHDVSRLAFGSRKDVGGWELHIDSKDKVEIHYSGFRTPHMHNLTELVQGTLGAHSQRVGHLQLPDSTEDSPNILVFQISAKLPFRTDVVFISGTGLKSSRDEERVSIITGDMLTSQLNDKQKGFEDKYKNHFNLTDKVASESAIVGRAAIGNLLGGIGYFYGQSRIALPSDSSHKDGENFVPYWPAELYTAVPSRPIFPRGFLWDEGFHLLLICRWDIRICLDIIGHWLDLMNIDGWIPREQILGAEALSKISERFVTQNPSNGNPPTLLLPIHDLIRGAKGNKFSTTENDEISSFLDRAFVRLEAWFQWFNTTQSGKDASSYYWHGRDGTTNQELNPQTLTSGLDDYPRASHPNEEERHLDLRCWMLLAADRMHSITELLDKKNGLAKEYHLMAKLLSDFEILNQMHFDNVSGAYFDFGNHTEKVRLSWRTTAASGSNYPTRELVREVLEVPQLRLGSSYWLCQLFSFDDGDHSFSKLDSPSSRSPCCRIKSLFTWHSVSFSQESWILGKQLDHISNRSILWTNYGLRSLAKTSSLYMAHNTEHDAPYWRGQIWMNMNYLILSGLHHYSQVDGPYKLRARTVYEELRENLIRNVVDNYYKTGYIWEQYDQSNKGKGKGKGAHPFTGWTSLILLIMAEAFPEI